MLTELASLRLLRILTVLMTIVMMGGFILIVSLLSIAIKKNIEFKESPKFYETTIANNEFLSSVTYSPQYTILLITNNENTQYLRILSNKTGKTLSTTLVSDLINQDSERKCCN